MDQNQMSHFYLPGFDRNTALFILLADFRQHIPQWFYEDVEIASVYGSFPNCIWNGGRTQLDRITKTSMRTTIEAFNQRGIAVRFTFTNPLIEKKHLSDTLCNMCLEMTNNGMNEVIVNSPILEEYIRNNYPNFKLISSTTKCLEKKEEIVKELEKDYYLVVTDSSLNNTEELFQFPHKEKIELLVNHACRIYCPNRRAHYIASGKAQMEFDEPQFLRCPYAGRDFEEIRDTNPSFISREMIDNKYKPAGFHHFKLDGRSFTDENLVKNLMHYLIKPEYQEKMTGIIQKEIYDRFEAMKL